MLRLLNIWTVLCLANTAPANGQAPKANAPIAQQPDLKVMYEDIEILRRILVKDFGSQPNVPVSSNNSAHYDDMVRRGLEWLNQNQNPYLGLGDTENNPHRSLKRAALATIEGAYLKGHGVAYTLSVNAAEQAVYDASTKGIGLISVCSKCHPAESIDQFLKSGVPNRAQPKLSDWEKARRDVRGEKTESQPSNASSFRMQSNCAPGNLTEKILKVVAENGHNFKQLSGAENITVVITFAPPRAEAIDSYHRKAAAPPTLRVAEEKATLGDLHLKQQKNAEAISSYAEAIKQLESGPLSFAADTNYDRVQQYLEDAQKLLRGSYTKQAQALLALGKTSEAREALTKAESVTIKINVNNLAPAPKVSPNQPAKLLITVSKKALDQHHEGKLPLEQLRKDAEVQTINLPVADKK